MKCLGIDGRRILKRNFEKAVRTYARFKQLGIGFSGPLDFVNRELFFTA